VPWVKIREGQADERACGAMAAIGDDGGRVVAQFRALRFIIHSYIHYLFIIVYLFIIHSSWSAFVVIVAADVVAVVLLMSRFFFYSLEM